MVFDGLRAYLQLANGLTDVTKARAMATARSLVQQGEAGVATVLPDQLKGQVSSIAEDLLATSRANRDLLVGLVRVEVERSVSRLGLVSATELEAATHRAQLLADRVQDLERSLRAAQERPAAGDASGTPTKGAAKTATAQKRTATKATAKKVAATTATGTTATKATGTTATTATGTTATKAAATKATATKATATKATGTRARKETG